MSDEAPNFSQGASFENDHPAPQPETLADDSQSAILEDDPGPDLRLVIDLTDSDRSDENKSITNNLQDLDPSDEDVIDRDLDQLPTELHLVDLDSDLDSDKDLEAEDEPEEDTEELSGFAALGLSGELLETVTELGYTDPTPIQAEAIPQLLLGVDMVGQAATGTGKTAAFALPILNNLRTKGKPKPQALVVVPTRELAVQVSEAMRSYGKKRGARVLAIFGGQPIGRQFKELDRGVHVVVATPGRALDHIKRGSLKLGQIETVVLDEADEMLDMGFVEDIESILDATPDERQTVLFSATMPPRIANLAKRYQTDPTRIQIKRSKAEEGSKALIRQVVYMVQRNHKAAALGRVLDIEEPKSTIIFCKTRSDVDELTVKMNARGYRAEALHGGMDQMQRDRVMRRLRDGAAQLLVATDVAARGLDVDSLTHVVNYDVPTAAESYVHRIGRVGRAGREGTAITLAEPKQRRLLKNIERLTKQKIDVEKVPSVADLRAKQIEITVTAVREALASDDLEDYNSVLHGLAGEDNDRNLALAAIKLAHVARVGTVDERDIPDASQFASKERGGRKKEFGRNKFEGKNRNSKNGHRKGKGSNKGRSFKGSADTGFLYVNVGAKMGLRPADLVGAVANESGLSGRDIGPIRISDHYSVVGVPESSVSDVVRSMKGTKVRGKKAAVRRYEENA